MYGPILRAVYDGLLCYIGGNSMNASLFINHLSIFQERFCFFDHTLLSCFHCLLNTKLGALRLHRMFVARSLWGESWFDLCICIPNVLFLLADNISCSLIFFFPDALRVSSIPYPAIDWNNGHHVRGLICCCSRLQPSVYINYSIDSLKAFRRKLI